MWPMMTTPNRAALSILGLYEWDDRIMDLIHLPAGVDPEEVKQNILMECAELTVIYPDWDFMHKAIDWWSRKELPTWEHVYEMTQLDYNPIENYDRMENELEQENVSEKRLRASQTARNNERENTVEGKGISTDEALSNSQTQSGAAHSVAGFNSNDLAVQSGDNSTGYDTTKTNSGSSVQNSTTTKDSGSDSEMQNELHNGDEKRDHARSLHAHGNIGTTTVAQMMEGEINTYPKINIVNYITQAFKQRFCVMVY